MSSIAANLQHTLAEIRHLSTATGRDAQAVTLVAVSKTKSAAAIREAHTAGQRDFGENYLQEAVDKMQELADLTATWHFLGPIQSNKTQSIARHFDWVHSVDRLKIAERLSRQRPPELPALQICLQVNIDNSPSKSGCAVDEALLLAKSIAQLPNLHLRGLMAVPAPDSGPKPFAALQQLMQNINEQTTLVLDTLSMGMSADMADAIANGATIVRIGTAIFGARN